MDPYEEVAQQGQIHPLSPAYVPDLMELDEHVPVHILKPEHPEFHAPSDDDIQVKDDDKDPEEDLSEKHEPEDSNEDPEEDPNEEHEHEDENSDETEPFKEDETAVTPPPPKHHGARIYVRPQTPIAASTKALIDAFATGSSLFPLPPTSTAQNQAPFGHKAAMIYRRDDIPKEDIPLRKRFAFTVPHLVLVMIPKLLLELLTRDIRLEIDVVRGQRTAYEIELHEVMPVTRQGTNDAMTPESIQAMIDWAIQRNSTHTQDDASQNLGGGLRRPVQPALCYLHSASAALTWWNGHVRTLGHEVAYAMTTGNLKKKMTDRYCLKGEIKKLEIKLWNLRVKGNDVVAYT
nr:reverse transcriptase domain-containing protein [Tanacetum cinerariifolium]